MPRDKGGVQDAAVAAIGIGSAMLLGIVLGLVEALAGIAIYSFSILVILPIESLLAGAAAAGGYYLGAVLLNRKPAGGLAFNMVAASLGAFILVHYVPYFLFEIEGIRVRDEISFLTYLDFVIRNTSIVVGQGRGTEFELGSAMGYVNAGLQLGGFALGGLSVFGLLLEKPFHDPCHQYFKRSRKRERYCGDAQELVGKIQTFEQLVADKRFDEALAYHKNEMGVATFAKGNELLTRITTLRCPGCGLNMLRFTVHKWNGNDWKQIPELAFTERTETELGALT